MGKQEIRNFRRTVLKKRILINRIVEIAGTHSELDLHGINRTEGTELNVTAGAAVRPERGGLIRV